MQPAAPPLPTGSTASWCAWSAPAARSSPISGSRETRFHGAPRQTLLADSLDQLAAVGRGERLAPGGRRRKRIRARCPAHHALARRRCAAHRATRGKDFLGHAARALAHHRRAHARRAARQGLAKAQQRPLARLRDGGKRRARSGGSLAIPRRLLPSRSDGSTTPQPIDDKTAAELHPHAHQVYAPLPSRPLKPLDVLKFSSARAHCATFSSWWWWAGDGLARKLVPLLTGQIFDRIIPGAERGLLRELTMVLLAVFGGQLLFDLARGLALVRAQTLMDTRLEAGSLGSLAQPPAALLPPLLRGRSGRARRGHRRDPPSPRWRDPLRDAERRLLALELRAALLHRSENCRSPQPGS